jgi:hypothetical protein
VIFEVNAEVADEFMSVTPEMGKTSKICHIPFKLLYKNESGGACCHG